MITTIRYILLTALRDWLFFGLFIAIFVAFAISSFLGDAALVEEGQMSFAFASGSTRIILIVGLIVFVCFHVRTAFANREIDVILSRPISRSAFVFAYWAGFSFVAILLIIPLAIAISYFQEVNQIGLIYWTGSLILESFLIIAFSLFSSLILRSAVSSVLLCFSFYFIARMMGFFLYIIDKPYLFRHFDFGAVTEKGINAASAILPRLDLYGHSEWLVYGITENTDLLFITQTLFYVPFLLAMAIFDFKRKQF